MPKMTTATAVFITFLALSAPTSMTASAATAGWMVNGSRLSGTKALATTAIVDKNWVLKSQAADIVFECTGGTLNSVTPAIESPNTGSATSLEFTSCKPLTGLCSLEPTDIRTVSILVETTLDGTLAVITTIKPRTKTTLWTIKFTGENCTLASTEAVTGRIRMLAPIGQDENTVQDFNSLATEESGELKILSSPWSFTGAVLLRLATSEAWSFL